MDINNIIDETARIAAEVSPELVKSVEQIRQTITRDGATIAVIGDFKAGKSTLLNRLFLNADYLPTDTLSATAVPTYLSSGGPELQVWTRGEDGVETIVETSQLFNNEKIRKVVTASDKKERGALARRHCKVCVKLPGILPEGITIVDTPGLNDIDSNIYCNTILEARKADAIIYVVHDKQLSERECCLLADLVGSQRNKIPVHVVFTLSSKESKAPGQIKVVCSEILSALADQGISCGISVFYFKEENKATSAALKEGQTSGDMGFASWGDFDIIEEPSVEKQVPTPQLALDNVRKEICDFVNGPAQRGRHSRICRELAEVLTKLALVIDSRIQVAGVEASKLQELKSELQDKKKEFNRVVAALLQDVRSIQITYLSTLDSEMDSIQDYYIDNLNKQESAGQILATIKEWQNDIPTRIHRTLKKCNYNLQQEMGRLTIKYNTQFQEASPQKISVIMENNTLIKCVTKVPAWVLIAADYLLVELISPLPPIIDIPLRMLLEKIPGICKLLPAHILADQARHVVIKQLKNCIASIKEQVETNLENRFDEMNQKCAKALCDNGVYAEYEKAIEEVEQKALTLDDVARLRAHRDVIEHWNKNI